MASKETSVYFGASSSHGWELMFPCLLWNGRGGPDTSIYTKITLRDWIHYVIRLQEGIFHNNILFICYANTILRRQRISGLTSHKPISASVSEEVKELIRIAKSESHETVCEATLQSLSKRVGVYSTSVPGSI